MQIILFLFGLCIGSFLNVLIDRLPNDESVIKGRSHCDHCKRTLNWYELIPLLSFLFQGGKSKCCHRKLSIQYPLIELATGIGFVAILMNGLNIYNHSTIQPFSHEVSILLMNLIIFSCLLVIFVTDLKTFIIPDSMVVIGILASIMKLFILHNSNFMIQNVMAAIGAGLFFYILYLITRGRGMGFGDVKLALVLGLITGFPGIIINLYVAFLTGAFIGVILILYRKKSFKSQVPFGPFLILGTWVSILWQTQIISWWKGII